MFLGGGRRNFIPDTQPDPEYPDETGDRGDGRDLIQEWRDVMSNDNGFTEGVEFAYVDSLEAFEALDTNTIQHLFGEWRHFSEIRNF